MAEKIKMKKWLSKCTREPRGNAQSDECWTRVVACDKTCSGTLKALSLAFHPRTRDREVRPMIADCVCASTHGQANRNQTAASFAGSCWILYLAVTHDSTSERESARESARERVCVCVCQGEQGRGNSGARHAQTRASITARRTLADAVVRCLLRKHKLCCCCFRIFFARRIGLEQKPMQQARSHLPNTVHQCP